MPRKATRNAQGSGTIRQRPDGRWEARFTVGRDPGTGKQIQKSVYGKTQKEVRQKLAQITTEIDDGTYAEPSKMTVGEWMDVWYAEYLGALKPNTVARYAVDINHHIKPNIGTIKLSSLNAQTIQTFYNRQLRSPKNPNGLSPKTIKNLHGVLHKALNQAVRLGYIRSNPADSCVLPRIEKKEVSFIEENNISKLLEEIKGHKFETLYKVALFTGMREGEILGLTWDCVDFKNGIITVSKQLQRNRIDGGKYGLVSLKNDRTRKIHPAQFVMDTLQQQRKTQLQNRMLAGGLWQNEWNLVFTSETGNFLRFDNVYKNFKRIVAKIGIAQTRFHDIRHTFAMISLQNGDDLKTVQENVGHATAAFTLDVYGHASQRMKQESANRMQAFISA